ncbi:adhesion G-protein coupled receptor D1-like [Lineus longissimus]|uniref:adhesion G-protein coupled receptor D1-like n=1 Tax=Lineus longissimus TaxID=88925 RepID=UPI00315C79B3
MTRHQVSAVLDAMTAVSQSENITEKTAEMFLNASSALLNENNQEHMNNQTVDLLETVEAFVRNAAEQMDHEWIQVQENLEIQIIPIETNGTQSVATRDQERRIAIEIPVDSEVNGTLAAVMYKTLHEDLPTTTPSKSRSEIVSHVVSVSIMGVYNVGKPSRIIFKSSKHDHPRNCFYWNFTQNMWNQDGCRKSDENVSHVTCECDHMTNFAILMSYSEKGVTEGSQALGVITMVGSGISITCLFTTIVIYGCLRLLLQERYMVHANLAMSLLIGQLVFVLGSQASGNPDICRLVAFLLHFAFLGSFSWTAMEGLQLYRKSVRIFNPGGDMRAVYVVIGWGIPVIVVGVCFGVGFADYGARADGFGSQSCWLHGSIRWGFIGPAIAIMVFNITIVGLVLRVLLSLKAITNKSGVQKIKSGLKALMVLVPLLGLTWVCGFLVSVDICFEYIFDICLPLQGVLLFVFHCLLNDEVKTKLNLHRRIMKVSPAPSSTMSTLTRMNSSKITTKLILASNMLSPLPSKFSQLQEEFSPRKKVLIPRSGTMEPGSHTCS